VTAGAGSVRTRYLRTGSSGPAGNGLDAKLVTRAARDYPTIRNASDQLAIVGAMLPDLPQSKNLMNEREFQIGPTAPAGSRRRSTAPELEIQNAHEQGEAHSVRDYDDEIVFQNAVDDP